MTEDPAAAMERRIEEEGIEHVLVELPDINGISRVKQLSAESFLETWREGPAMNLAVLVQTPRNDVPTGSGLAEEIEDGLVPATSHKHECIAWATEAVMPFYELLEAYGEGYGVPLDSIQHEHGPGQLEVLFEYDAPLAGADRTFDFKRLVKQTARLADQHATFMAKPFAGESGSGYHLHVSTVEDGENAFADGEALSERGRHFLGGLLDHADALAAVGTPTLNGFKRFDPDGFVPYTASWGWDNRQTMVRIPAGTTRFESRIGAADANPYLVIAATLAAGLDGMREGLDPGDAVIRAYVATKRRELEAFRDTVTDWEREQYVETL